LRPRWERGPATITVVRHGESVGNLADARARGRQQGAALAAWLESDQGRPDRPDAVVCSPFRRAIDTAALATKGRDVAVVNDERLRERDLGLFDGLTSHGIRATYPEEAERRHRLGKFYYQPPSGESWCDVVLRIRSLLRDLDCRFPDANLWLVTHQAVILSIRFVLEGLEEKRLLDIDRSSPLPNASLTVFRAVDDGYVLDRYGDARPVDRLDAEVTHETDAHQVAGENEAADA
jgi:broad specificity phosphatase PhoE